MDFWLLSESIDLWKITPDFYNNFSDFGGRGRSGVPPPSRRYWLSGRNDRNEDGKTCICNYSCSVAFLRKIQGFIQPPTPFPTLPQTRYDQKDQTTTPNPTPGQRISCFPLKMKNIQFFYWILIKDFKKLLTFSQLFDVRPNARKAKAGAVNFCWKIC